MKIRYFLVFDDVGSEDVDHQNDDKDEGLDVESLGTHREKLSICYY